MQMTIYGILTYAPNFIDNFLLQQSLCCWQLVKTADDAVELMYEDLLLVLIQWSPEPDSSVQRLVSGVRTYLAPRPELDPISTAIFRAATRGADAALRDRLSKGPIMINEVLGLISEKMLRATTLYRDLMEIHHKYSLCVTYDDQKIGSGLLRMMTTFVGRRVPRKYLLGISLDFRSTTYPYGAAFNEIQSRLIYDFSALDPRPSHHLLETVSPRDFSGMHSLQRLLHSVSSIVG
jgi:hypothetical protein